MTSIVTVIVIALLVFCALMLQGAYVVLKNIQDRMDTAAGELGDIRRLLEREVDEATQRRLHGRG